MIFLAKRLQLFWLLFPLFLAGTCFGQTATSIALSSSANPSVYGRQIALTASVTPASATGKVTFYDGTTILGTASLLNGAAKLNVVPPTSGARILQARYPGDGTNSSALSASLSQTVNALTSGAFTADKPVAFSPQATNAFAVADFDNDGRMDIATGSSILMGNGDGTFRTLSLSPSGAASISAGDFNGDGRMDLASIPYAAGNLVILLGNGDGTFQPPLTVLPNIVPNAAVADFNNDGLADLAVTPVNSPTEILLSNGDGTFHQSPASLPGQPQQKLIVDLNSDGNVDIVLPSGIIYLGAGDGTFQAKGASVTQPFRINAQPFALSVADMNRDGKLDLIAYQSTILYIFPGNSDGTFGTPLSIPAPDAANSATTLGIADCDGDGNPDVVLDTSKGFIYVFTGKEDGTVRGAVPFPVEQVALDDLQAPQLIAGEFNGDGSTDLVFTRGHTKPEIFLLFGLAGSFPSAVDVHLPATTGGIRYSASLKAAGGPTPWSWTLCSGQPPSGIQLTPPGQLTGIPPAVSSTTSTFTFSAFVSGPVGPGFYSGLISSIQFNTPISITSLAHYVPEQGVPTGYQLTATGGTSPYQNWRVIGGALPPGMIVDSNTGLISGTPTETGTFSFTLTVDDGAGLTSLPRPATLEVIGPPSIANPDLPDTFTGVPYYYVLKGKGGVTADGSGYQSWLVTSGSLPPGLTLDPKTGAISGTPSAPAGSVWSFTAIFISVYQNAKSAPQALSINVASPGTVGITLTSSANPSPLGKPITLTAHVTGATRAGRVTFYDGSQPIGATKVVGEEASLSVTLGAGKHALAARFFLPPAAAFLSQTVRAIAAHSYQAPALYGTGVVTSATATAFVADFNGDGKPDLATSSYVLIGNGDGTFRILRSPSDVSGHPLVVSAVADFDEDGIPDVVAGSAVLKGQGDGTFAFSLGEGAIPPFVGDDGQLTIADFNTDGHVDLLIGQNLWLGIGDGNFRASVTLDFLFRAHLGIGPIAVADFNGDGIPDIAQLDVAEYFVAVYLGNGDGTFQAGVHYASISNTLNPLTSAGLFVAAADVDNDGSQDLLTGGPNYAIFSVLKGRGDGTFQPAVDYPGPGNRPFGVAVSDFNGDGVPDLVFPSDNSLNREAPVAMVAGLGGGAFGDTSYGLPLPPIPMTSLHAYQALAADFNNDGRPDIAEVVSDGTVQFLIANQEASGKLTATPASFSAQTVWPSDFHKSFTVNLTYHTTEAIPPMFTAGLSSDATLTASLPSAGQMLLSSVEGGVYTYAARFDVVLSTGADTGFHSASLLFRVGDSKASIPVSLIGNTSFADGSAPAIAGVFNAAAGGQAINGVVAEGSYIAIYGTGLAGTGSPAATALPLPTTLNSTLLKWASPAHLLYASANQVNALVPQDLFTYSQLFTFTGPSGSLPVNLSLVALQPGIYTQDTSGSGPGVIANAFTGQLIDASHPAHAGDYVVVYCTGLGRVTGPNGEAAPADGAAAPLNTIYHTAAQVTATIGGVNAPVGFSGLTPGFAGLYQVNIQIPPGVPSGAVPMILKAENSTRGSIANSNLVTIQLQ